MPQFDFSVPGERPLRWSTVETWARAAEAAGFGSLWLADHLFWDLSRYGGPTEPEGGFDPLAALGGLARLTRRARIGTLVLCAPLRPPSVVAKALATLDVLSGGRLTVGLGAGWYEPEFEAAGVPFLGPGARLGQLEETVTVLRGLFGGGPFSFSGRWCAVEEACCLPRPLQHQGPPIWLGGRGDRLLRLVAARADGWNTVWVWTPEQYRERLRVLEAACEAEGRDPASVTRALGLYTLVGEDEADLRRRFRRLQERSPHGVVAGRSLEEWRRGRLVGTVEQVREQVASWADMGVDELIVGTGAVPYTVVDLGDVDMIAMATNLERSWEVSEPLS